MGFFLVVVSGGLLSSYGVQPSYCGGFFCCGATELECLRASGFVACTLSSYGSLVLEHRLNSCGAWA